MSPVGWRGRSEILVHFLPALSPLSYVRKLTPCFRALSAAAEERELAALVVDAPLGDCEVFLVQLEADIMPA